MFLVKALLALARIEEHKASTWRAITAMMKDSQRERETRQIATKKEK